MTSTQHAHKCRQQDACHQAEIKEKQERLDASWHAQVFSRRSTGGLDTVCARQGVPVLRTNHNQLCTPALSYKSPPCVLDLTFLRELGVASPSSARLLNNRLLGGSLALFVLMCGDPKPSMPIGPPSMPATSPGPSSATSSSSEMASRS